MNPTSFPFAAVPKLFSLSGALPNPKAEQSRESLLVGGAPPELIPCPRCSRPLMHVLTIPLGVSKEFGAKAAIPVYVCPEEESEQLLVYQLSDNGGAVIVDFLHGTSGRMESEILQSQAQVQLGVCEYDLGDLTSAVDLLKEAQQLSPYALDEFLELDERLTQLWSEVLQSPVQTSGDGVPQVLLGTVTPGAFRITPGRCPLTGEFMNHVGRIASSVGGVRWTEFEENQITLSFCPTSSVVVMQSGRFYEHPWICD
jgi:hypothetical protein